MKKTITLVFVAFLCFQLNAQTKLKPTQLFWTGSAAFSSYELTGSVLLEKGEIEIRNDSLVKLNVMVNMKSLDHENSTLKKHLRSEDFFEVNSYKTALFQLKEPAVIKNSTTKISGDLKIKGVIKPQIFRISFNSNYSVMFLDITINRTDYGITYNSPTYFEKLKDDAIADEFNLKGEIRIE